LLHRGERFCFPNSPQWHKVFLQESRLCVAVFLRFGIWSVDDSFDGHNQFPKLSLGVKFTDGLEIVAKPASRQLATAAA
jgi:hypothetical protein